MKEVGLYIHIPFCKQKCFYCDFNSYVCNDALIDQYIAALLSELKMVQDSGSYQYKTVFFGGGTPTFIHYKHIAAIMDAISPYIMQGAEVSMECNPGTVSSESLRAYNKMGINRLSIGLQAWQPALQKSLGRIHDTRQFLENFQEARSAGFENISVDLMFSLPGQSLDMWVETLAHVISLGVKHVSCYSLKVEEGTPFYKLVQQDKLQLPEEELDREMYHQAIALLQEKGLQQYEISNFAVQGYECKHNLVYWENREYIGVGAGSHSKLEGVRYSNYRSIDTYMKCIEENSLPVEERLPISLEEEKWETIFLALRLNKGLDVDAFNERYQADFLQSYKKALTKLQANGLVRLEDHHLKLTSLGMDLSNSVFIEFMD